MAAQALSLPASVRRALAAKTWAASVAFTRRIAWLLRQLDAWAIQLPGPPVLDVEAGRVRPREAVAVVLTVGQLRRLLPGREAAAVDSVLRDGQLPPRGTAGQHRRDVAAFRRARLRTAAYVGPDARRELERRHTAARYRWRPCRRRPPVPMLLVWLPQASAAANEFAVRPPSLAAVA